MIQIKAKSNLQITSLNLSNKGLQTIPKEVFHCTNLKKLNLAKNKISYLPLELAKLTKLEVLDISQNQIKDIKSRIFDLNKLRILNLSHNKLKHLPTQITKLNKLDTLIIHNNELTTLSGIQIPRTVKSLNICNNYISDLSWIYELTNLQSLWIGNNPVEILNIKSIYAIKTLKRLYTFSPNRSLPMPDSIYASLAKIKGNIFSAKKLDNNIINNEMTRKETIKIQKPHKIFISYSHADVKWLDRVQLNLKVLENLNIEFDLWTDTMIKVGEEWLPKIKEAVNDADVAILLVSTSFLASEFIMKNEVPQLLANAESKGTTIVPVILSPCLFLNSSIAKFQAINKPDRGKTLAESADHEQDRLLMDLALNIKEIIENKHK